MSASWRPPATLDDVPGWFYPDDQALLTWLLDRQDRLEPPGDLLELGAYLGKSAILLGTHLRPGERLVVCDLFDSAAPDDENTVEMARSYATLTRTTFERNYLTFHERLPVIVEGPSTVIAQHVTPGSCRLVHVDASHLYEHVRGDIETSRTLLRPDGLLVCDDFRAAHTPGVAAAVWSAVTTAGLRPLCLSPNKFYGTWGDPGPIQEELIAWLRGQGEETVDIQHIAGVRVVRTGSWRQPPRPVLAPRLGPAPRARRARTMDARSWPRAVAKDLLPPVLTRALRRARSRVAR
jgi:predicted O-methyltransferase YrrM